MPKLYLDNAPLASGGAAQMPTNPAAGQGMQAVGRAVQGVGDMLTTVQLAFDKEMKAAQRVTDVSGEYNATVTSFYDRLETLKREHAEKPEEYRKAATQALQDRIKQGRENLKTKDAQTINAYEAQANGYMAQLTPHLFTDAAAMVDTRSKQTRQDGATQWMKDHIGEQDPDTLRTRWEIFKQSTYLPAIKANLISPAQAKLELTAISQQFFTERATLKMQTDPKAALAELNKDLFSGPTYEAVAMDSTGKQINQPKEVITSLGRTFMPTEALKVFNAMAAAKEQGTDLERKHGKEYWQTESNARYLAHTQGNYSVRQHMQDMGQFKDQPELHEHLLNRMVAYDTALLNSHDAALTREEKAKEQVAGAAHKQLSAYLAFGRDIETDPEAQKAWKLYVDNATKSDEYATMVKAIANQARFGPGNPELAADMEMDLTENPARYSVPYIVAQASMTQAERTKLLQVKETWETHVKTHGENWMSSNAKNLEDRLPGQLGTNNFTGNAAMNRAVSAARIQFRYAVKRQVDANNGRPLTPEDELQIYRNVVKMGKQSVKNIPFGVPPEIKAKYPISREGYTKFLKDKQDTMGVKDPSKFLEISEGFLTEIARQDNLAPDQDEEDEDQKQKQRTK